MTRERVEQALNRHYQVCAIHTGRADISEALTTLSNALAESEKERERLREALRAVWLRSVYDTPEVLGEMARQALSPDSQEK